jgi:hypothetical protein
MELFVAGIGVLGPGLADWPGSRAILRGDRPYVAQDLALSAPAILSGRERRRSSATTRLALSVAQEAVEGSGLRASDLAAVFGSSNGSGLETHLILKALTEPGMPVSPTQFHNSVHNSAAGYWCIATGCHHASTSIASHDYTFAAALLKAAGQVVTEKRPVLLTVSDCPLPAPLDAKRPIAGPFALSLVLTPQLSDRSLFRVSLQWRKGGLEEAKSVSPALTALAELWHGNPAGRALPLLEAFAVGKPARLSVQYPKTGRLDLEVSPC